MQHYNCFDTSISAETSKFLILGFAIIIIKINLTRCIRNGRKEKILTLTIKPVIKCLFVLFSQKSMLKLIPRWARYKSSSSDNSGPCLYALLKY